MNDKGDGLNLVNIAYRQSVAEHHLNLVLKCSYLNDLDDVDPFNISGVDRRKENEQRQEEVDVTAVITKKTLFAVNGKLVIVYLAL